MAKFMETGCRERESGPREGGESRFDRDQASFLLEKVLVVNGSAGYLAL